MSPSPPETCWPTPEQELLLKAALLPGEEAVRAWREVKAKVDPGDLDAASLRLLPLLWHNLARREGSGEDPSLEAARVSYRGTLAENTLLFHEAAFTLRELRAAGCPAMLLKGLALVERYYGHRGLRPMGDFDILIPSERREEVISRLQDAGWNPMSRGHEKFTRSYREVSHAHTFDRGSGWCVDLHWHAMEECVWPGADDDFWSGSEEIDFQGVPVAVMNPADQLLHVCVHGTKWESIPTLRWVADAAAVLTSSGSVLDWDRFADQAVKRDLVLPAGAALAYVKQLLGAPVPAEVLGRLDDLPVPGRERGEFERRTMKGSSRLFSFLPTLWYKHSRAERGAGLLGRALGFPSFVRKYWGMENWREFLSFVAAACGRKMRDVRR